MMDINTLKEKCAEYLRDFMFKVPTIDYEYSGIILSEGFSFCVMCNIYNIDVIIESGTGGGISTGIFAQYFNNKKIITIDNCGTYGKGVFDLAKKRLAKFKNIVFIKGEAEKKIGKIVNDNRSLNMALFLDGPKGKKAVELAKTCFQCHNVKVVHKKCIYIKKKCITCESYVRKTRN